MRIKLHINKLAGMTIVVNKVKKQRNLFEVCCTMYGSMIFILTALNAF